MDVPSPPLVNAKLCRIAAAVAGLGAAAFMLGCIALWSNPAWTDISIRETAKVFGPVTLTPGVRAAALLLNVAHMAVLSWGLLAMRRLFLGFAGGDAFGRGTGRLLRRFGIALMLFALLTPVVAAATSVLVTMQNPGGGLVTIGLSNHEVTLALVGALLMMCGSTLSEASRLAEENRQFV